MAERHVGHKHAGAAAGDERPAPARDQLLEEPCRERRANAWVHEGQAPSGEVQLVDRVATDLGHHVVDRCDRRVRRRPSRSRLGRSRERHGRARRSARSSRTVRSQRSAQDRTPGWAHPSCGASPFTRRRSFRDASTRPGSPTRCRRPRARGTPRPGTPPPEATQQPVSGRSRTTRRRADTRDSWPISTNATPVPSDPSATTASEGGPRERRSAHAQQAERRRPDRWRAPSMRAITGSAP